MTLRIEMLPKIESFCPTKGGDQHDSLLLSYARTFYSVLDVEFPKVAYGEGAAQYNE